MLVGNYRFEENYKLVDKVKEMIGGTATIFSYKGNEFVTNVINNGSRAIGSILNPVGKAIKNILKKESYHGMVDILGKPYLTAYEPIVDQNSNLIGIYYVGYPVSAFEELNNTISNTRILTNGFMALFDKKDRLVFFSDNKSEE